MKIYFILLFALCIRVETVKSLNVLAVFPYEGKSHFILFATYLKELANRGHNVTVISYFPQDHPLKNYHDISLVGTSKILEDAFELKNPSYSSILDVLFFIIKKGTENCKTLLANENVQNLWKSKVKFDVTVVEQFTSDCALGLAYKLGSPVVGLTSHILNTWHYERFGITYNPSFIPFVFVGGHTKPSLYQRIERTVLHTSFNFFYKFLSQRVDQNTLAQYFNDVPPLEELGRNMKFILTYTNFVLFNYNLLPPNVIEVGGYHVVKPKTLPDDIKNFIEESDHGVIYICFGSVIDPASIPEDKTNAIIHALTQLPQRVIWRWKGDNPPHNMTNIFFASWLPQNDILAHPKVVAFYSHCGLLSTTESLHHGIPMLGMPLFGDQPSNAAAVEQSGLGVQIQVSELTTEKLLEKFKIILDPKFRAQVKTISEAWHDRPVSAMDSAIYWTEYAAKYSNFTYRSPAADVPLYQYLCLDILLFFTLICSILIFLIRLFLLKLISSENRPPNLEKVKKS